MIVEQGLKRGASDVFLVVARKIVETDEVAIIVIGCEERHIGGSFREVGVIAGHTRNREQMIVLLIAVTLGFSFISKHLVRDPIFAVELIGIDLIESCQHPFIDLTAPGATLCRMIRQLAVHPPGIRVVSKINFLGDRRRPVIVEQGLKRGARRDRGLVFSSSASEQ